MQSNLKIATVHPTIENLQTAREIVAVASKANRLAQERALGAATRIAPHRWTRTIEKSLLGEQSSDDLRLDYEELSITFVSLLLNQRQASKSLQKARAAHNEALQQLVTTHDTISDRTPLSYVKQYLRAAYVVNSQESVEEKLNSKPQQPIDLPALAIERAKEIFIRTFLSLAQNIPVKNGYYTTVNAVKSGPYKSFPMNGFRKRDLSTIPVDPQDELTSSVQLYDQLQRTEIASKTAKEGQGAVSPYETLKEELYDANLLDTLCDLRGLKIETRSGSDVVDLIKRQRSDNLQNSIRFETGQLALLEFRKDYEKLVTLLVAAAAEATQLLQTARTREIRDFRIDSHWSLWTIMNNCLVADFKLREYGEQLKPFVDPPRAYDARETVRREFERLSGTASGAKSASQLHS